MPPLMSVLPARSIVTFSPCSTSTSWGNAAPPWETKYAGPVRGTFRIEVCTVAVATSDAAGHPAGLVLNCASVHALRSVVRREGSWLGSCTSTLPTFASPGLATSLTSRLAPCALLACPLVEAVNDGLNGSVAQPPAWKRSDKTAVLPAVLDSSPVTAIVAQLVGFNVNWLRFISTLT